MRNKYSLNLRRIQLWIFTSCIFKLMRISISLQLLQRWNTVKRTKFRLKRWERKPSQKMLSYAEVIPTRKAISGCPFPTINIAGCVVSIMMIIKLTLIQRNMRAKLPWVRHYMISSKKNWKISTKRVLLKSGKHPLWRLFLTRNKISNAVLQSNWNSLA